MATGVLVRRTSVVALVRSTSSAKCLMSPRPAPPVTSTEYVKVYSPGGKLPTKDPSATRFVCVSDTHGLTDFLRLPEGDVLLHAGDFTETGKLEEVAHFNSWLALQNFRHKIVIAGNHDVTFDMAWYSNPQNQKRFHRYCQDPEAARGLLTNCTYLQDSLAIIDDKWKIWGTPWQPEFCNWAFNLPRGSSLKEKWDLIPNDVDILLSHGPPANHGGLIRWDNSDVGCEELHSAVMKRVKPKVHVFGHVHEGYGVTSEGSSVFINASTCTHSYKPSNPPVVFDLIDPKKK